MSIERRFEILPAGEVASSTLADDLRRGFRARPRSLPPKHFYDAHGSELFDRICDLPEYYLTRAERALLERVAPSIAAHTRATVLLEIGSGMARKTALLLHAIAARGAMPLYVPLDISRDALEASAAPLLAEVPAVFVRAVVGEFPRDIHRMAAAATPSPSRSRLFAFLGSTIGNLDEDAAPALLRAVSAEMTTRDSFLLGVDLAKDPRALVAAYDDAQGVTALFNKNVLAVVNRELGADFDLEGFAHEATWNAERSRMEMRLRSLRAQRVTVRALDESYDLEEGERILTEISRKFTRESAAATLAAGGMVLDEWYTLEGVFALALARRA